MQSTTSQEFIAAMRTVASSVSVVTTDGDAGRYGATVSAFCSVSANPPTVLVCLNAASTIAAKVSDNRAFCVNVLPDHASYIADRFAGRHDTFIQDRFEGMDVTGPDFGPVHGLAGATSLQCQLTQAVMEGTHLICIGRVTQIALGSEMPLTYLAGQYQTSVPTKAAMP
ncbi:flavin reductase family protein [Ascidiaceihabitans sp.]|uniref:flavin reductase family protein n=1 Tax=Ascidiaceihabitans sp. TaxID=1872644 RepID=UPI0032977E1A